MKDNDTFTKQYQTKKFLLMLFIQSENYVVCSFMNNFFELFQKSQTDATIQGAGIFTIKNVIGALLIIFNSGISSLAGLGGGGPSVVILIMFFDFLPKDATIIVFACIMGASLGNIINQMQRALNDQPVVHYQYAFVVTPIMFMGSIFGVLFNKIAPSILTVSFIMGVAFMSLPSIYRRFRQGYHRQTQLLLQREENNRVSDAIKQTRINPFSVEFNRQIFKHMFILLAVFVALSLIRGSGSLPSIIGIQSCTMTYWIIQIVIIGVCWSFYSRNHHLIQVWTAPSVTLGEELFERKDIITLNRKEIFKGGFLAGFFSGLGLGGGIFLVPLYRGLKLTPIQATSTCIFSVFIVSTVNVIQALFLGILSISKFLILFSLCGLGSLFLSIVISNYLRKKNRISMVQLLLFVILAIANILLPISLYMKYKESGGDVDVVFGFGSPC